MNTLAKKLNNMKFLFFGDVVGKIGRKAIAKILPELKAEYQPDFVMANAENIAHGTGFTRNTLEELTAAGVDFFTSGNHAFNKPEAEEILSASDAKIIRPANYPVGVAGPDYRIFPVGSRNILLINLMGRVFIREQFDDPFRKLDEILNKVDLKKISGIIVDFHTEATSEQNALGWYADGRVTAVLGTHTHVPTADNRILPLGTAFISDIGMVGAQNSIIGFGKEQIIKNFLNQTGNVFEVPENGQVQINAVLVEFDPKTKLASDIQRVDKFVLI